jgi:yecA family protein
MDSESDDEFGLLRQEDIEELDRILSDRSRGNYGAPALHGLLVASVVGPEPIPKNEILQMALTFDHPRAIDFADFPELAWVERKVDDWLTRIERVFREEPRAFTLLVHQPKLNEGDATPDPRAWCQGFLGAMEYRQKEWMPFLESRNSFGILAPILITAEGGKWEMKDVPNPFADLDLTPEQMCGVLQVSILGIDSFWKLYRQDR